MSAHQMVTLPTRFKFRQNSKLLGHIQCKTFFHEMQSGNFHYDIIHYHITFLLSKTVSKGTKLVEGIG